MELDLLFVSVVYSYLLVILLSIHVDAVSIQVQDAEFIFNNMKIL